MAHSHTRNHYSPENLGTKSTRWFQTQSSWPSRMIITVSLFFYMMGFLWSLLTILYPLLIYTWPYPEACGRRMHTWTWRQLELCLLLLKWTRSSSVMAMLSLRGQEAISSYICYIEIIAILMGLPIFLFYWLNFFDNYIHVYVMLYSNYSHPTVSSFHSWHPFLYSTSLFFTLKSFCLFYDYRFGAVDWRLAGLPFGI